jgi:peptidoglycan/LPS O-acetylase OafA/YrhL
VKQPPTSQHLLGLFEIEGPARLHALDGLRGIAIFLVFCTHFCEHFSPLMPRGTLPAAMASGLGILGHTGVELFFVLSGYLIYGIWMKPATSTAGFYRRRLLRIYPTFFVVFCLYLFLSLHPAAPAKIPTALGNAFGYVLANLLLLPGILDIAPLITVTWSLSYEALFYVAIPAVMLGLRLRERPISSRIAILSAGFTAIVGWCLFFGWFALPALHWAPGSYHRMSMFAAGMLAFELSYRPSPWLVSALLALGAFFYVRLDGGSAWYAALSSWTNKPQALQSVALAPAFLALMLCALAPGRLASTLSNPGLRVLGNVSYSFFLIHGLAVKALSLILVPTLGPAAVWKWAIAFPLAFAVSCAAALPLFLCVEKPLSLDRLAALRRRP